MSRLLAVDPTGFGVRGGLLDDGRLIEVWDADAAGEAVTDALLLGRVVRVDARLDAAFVDIGAAEPAFLGAKDARPLAGAGERAPIGRLAREGERVIVQGLREAVGDKGPRVTADVRLFGFLIIFRPLGTGVELPGRLPERQRAALAERGAALFGDAGVTLRRAAARAEDGALLAELEALRGRWARLRAEARRRPGRLAADEPPLERLLRQALEQAPERLAIADPALAATAERLVGERLGALAPRIERLRPEASAFAQTDAAAELERALRPAVALPGGGRLLIEETAACTAIDVDGGPRPALEVDLAAAAEVARQVRLRNLGGTIVVDFVDLPTRPQRQRLEEALKKAFRDDPLPVQIYPMSPLGLVQLSRPRRGQTLAARLTRPCAACAGTGRAPSLRAAAEALLAELRSAPLPRRVVIARDLAAYLQGEAGWAWEAVAGRPELVADDNLAPGTFRLARP
jgi:Rne/Rng family ribonuclease